MTFAQRLTINDRPRAAPVCPTLQIRMFARLSPRHSTLIFEVELLSMSQRKSLPRRSLTLAAPL